MSKYNSSNYAFLLVGPYDLTDVTNKLEVSVSDPITDLTPFGAGSAVLAKPGIKKYAIEGHDAWYDDETYGINVALVSIAGSAGTFMFGHTGNTVGQGVICSQGFIQTGYKRAYSVGEMTKAGFECAVTGVIDDCKLISAHQTRTGTGSTESGYVDYNGLQPAGTTGGVMYLSVQGIAWNGATALAVEVEHGSTPPTFVSHTAFTSITSAGYPNGYYSEAKAMAGTINRYLAVKWTFTGGTSPTAKFAVAVKVN